MKMYAQLHKMLKSSNMWLIFLLRREIDNRGEHGEKKEEGK